MTAKQLRTALTKIYGPNFHKPAAAELKVNLGTVYNQVSGKSRVPGAVEAWIKLKLKEQTSAA